MPTQKSTARLSKKPPLSPEELKQIDAYWRAANYLTACQLYLLDNPLLERPLCESDLKQTIVGHWGTCPGQNFIYTHLDRVIKRDDLDMIYLSGPGHGGNAMVAQDWLDGSYTEVYPNITRDKEGMQKLFKRFSFPGGIPSHVAPETPGSIHEGGELGYSLAHAFGADAGLELGIVSRAQVLFALDDDVGFGERRFALVDDQVTGILDDDALKLRGETVWIFFLEQGVFRLGENLSLAVGQMSHRGDDVAVLRARLAAFGFDGVAVFAQSCEI